jgi:transcriptional regulator with XRE-family HTH domain
MNSHASSGETPDPRTATTNSEGIPYNERLQRIRALSGKSSQEIANLLGIGLAEYEEWENFPGELTRVISVRELSELASALGIVSRRIFEDTGGDGEPISPSRLSEMISSHLKTARISIGEFENRVGFEIEPCLRDVSIFLDWNVDCLRSVCAELGVDWLLALP